ncbi:hypothetical protein ABG067_008178, partial [Albugo candida]
MTGEQSDSENTGIQIRGLISKDINSRLGPQTKDDSESSGQTTSEREEAIIDDFLGEDLVNLIEYDTTGLMLMDDLALGLETNVVAATMNSLEDLRKDAEINLNLLEEATIRRRYEQRNEQNNVFKVATAVAIMCNMQSTMPTNDKEYKRYLNLRSLNISQLNPERTKGKTRAIKNLLRKIDPYESWENELKLPL